MNCPLCGAARPERTITCDHCGVTAAEADWLKLHQLEYLLAETANWPYKAQRWFYEQQRESLLAKLRPPEPVTEPAPPPLPIEQPARISEPASVTHQSARSAAKRRPSPRHEAVPFDQWLLSERNIKIALYSGGLLLILSGLIFVGINWTRIPGFGKLAITLVITLAMYLGGGWLGRRPAYRIGGVALLAIASGFLSLNFVVAQSYILGPRGFPTENMLLVAASVCLVAYSLTAIYTQSWLITVLGAGALVNVNAAVLIINEAQPAASLLVYSLTALLLLGSAAVAGRFERLAFATIPLGLLAHLALPLLYLAGVITWFFAPTGALFTAYFAILAAYVLTDWEWHRPVWQPWHQQHKLLSLLLQTPRWFSSLLGLSTLLLLSQQWRLPGWQTILLFGLLGAAYLRLAGRLQQAEKPLAGLPLVLAAYGSSLLATLLAIADTPSLIIALLANVLLLALSARLFQNYNFLFGAIWLLLAPIYLSLEHWLPGIVERGLYLGLLCLLYVTAGYFFGRRHLAIGMPYLTAAAALSVIVITMTWADGLVLPIVLVVVSLLYWLGAFWLKQTTLLLPALASLNLLIYALNREAWTTTARLDQALLLSYLAAGTLMLLAGQFLPNRWRRWRWPFAVAGATVVAGSYLISFNMRWAHTTTASLTTAGLLLAFAWWQKSKLKVGPQELPLLSYAGLLVLYITQFVVIAGLGNGRDSDSWPLLTTLFAAGCLALSWTLQRQPLEPVYGTPSRFSGLAFLIIPLAAAAAYGNFVITGYSFGLAALVMLLDALLRRTSRELTGALGLLFAGYELTVWQLPEHRPIFITLAACLTLAYVALSWLRLTHPYHLELRLVGLLAAIIPLGEALARGLSAGWSLTTTLTLAIISATVAADAIVRRQRYEFYASLGLVVLTIWSIWLEAAIGEEQAYILPLGLVLLGIGWAERHEQQQIRFQMASWLALLLLLGSAFLQSLPRDALGYAALASFEALLALLIGIRAHSRHYVVAGSVALLATALVQVGPAFIDLSRWAQLGITGTILLAAGLLALFRKEQLLATRRRLANEWRQWDV